MVFPSSLSNVKYVWEVFHKEIAISFIFLKINFVKIVCTSFYLYLNIEISPTLINFLVFLDYPLMIYSLFMQFHVGFAWNLCFIVSFIIGFKNYIWVGLCYRLSILNRKNDLIAIKFYYLINVYRSIVCASKRY